MPQASLRSQSLPSAIRPFRLRQTLRTLTVAAIISAAAISTGAPAAAQIPAIAAPVSATVTGNWTQQSPGTSPSAREDFSMAYDAATGTVVLFGGNTASGLAADTWTWNGTTWTQQSPPTSPPAREYSTMTYDPATGNVVLFGGVNRTDSTLADTWTWNGTTWTQQSPPTSPSARSNSTMAYDGATGNVVLFGGRNSTGSTLADTWTWNGTAWAQQSPATSPSARSDARMAYDPATGTVVLFGGSGAGFLSDTWTWNGTTWTQQSPATSPSARYLFTMAYDAAAGTVVLFGGDTNTGSGFAVLADTWTYDGTTWRHQSPATSPPARFASTTAYDAATGTVVLFGGLNTSGSVIGDTWTYNAGVITAPATAVGTAAAQTPVYFLIGTAGTLPALSNANVLTQGATGLDFTLGTGSTCVGAVTANQTCTVNVAFTPQFPGQRLGAVNLLDSSGTVLATAYINGVGTSPLTAWTLGTQTTLDNTLGDAFGIARDGAGDLFIAAYNVGKVYREKPTGSGGYTQSTVGSGFNNPTQIGVDGAGNVYICDVTNRSITKETLNPATGAYSQSVLFSQANNSGLNPYYALAVDAVGNLYFTSGGSTVQKATYANGTYTVSTLDSGFNFVIALAVDGSGNVYVADGNAATIYKETPGGSGYVRSSVNATGNGVSLVNGIAVDAGGTVYATASGNYTGVVRFAPNGSGGYTQLSTLGSFGRINGVALDPLGNLYVTSDPSGNVLVARIDRSDPPVLTYPTTPVSTSSAGTTLELDNIGNTALTLPVPTTGQNPSQSPYFTQSNSSTCPLVYSSSSSAGTLASGATCTEVLSYTPTVSGAVTGNLIFTDNSLNATGATQTVVETGSSLAVPNISVISQTIPQGTSSITLEFIVGYGGNTAPTGTPTLKVNGSTTNLGTVACTAKAGHNNCTATYNPFSLTPGVYTITATQSADSNYSTTSANGTLNITRTSSGPIRLGPVATAPAAPTPIMSAPVAANPAAATTLTTTSLKSPNSLAR